MKSTSIMSVLLTLTGLCAGCELAGPLLVSEATKGSEDPGSTSALLTVELESASGVVAGRTVAPEMFVADGERFGDQLSFRIATPDQGLEVLVMTNQAEGSSENPYTGDDGSGRGGIPLPPEPAPAPDGSDGSAGGGTLPDTGAFADVLVCESGVCRSATDFGFEVMQTENGRLAFVDGLWDADESIQLSFHYTENH
jgi:hypothetical protein